MKENSRFIGSQLLMALFLIVLALPAWGAPRRDAFGNMALVTQNDGNNLLLTMAKIATFNSPVTAMARLATWCGTPSKDNPCLIKILPGNYNLGSGSLTMQPYVDIEGSGEEITSITSAHNDATFSGVVNGADNAELRLLTVRNTLAGIGTGVAIANKSASPKITHVTAIAQTVLNCYALYNSGSSPTLNNVTAIVGGSTGYGVYNTDSSPVMNNLTITATPDFQSFGIYNAAASSPSVSNATIKTTGHFSNGIYTTDSSPSLRNIVVTTSGLNSFAMTNKTSTLVMNDVSINSLPGTNGFGMSNESSKLTLSNVTVSTTGPASCVSNVSSSVIADHCTVVGGISNDANSTMKLGASKITRGVFGDGMTCAACYDGNFIALGATCR
jgi:hypothetical protein